MPRGSVADTPKVETTETKPKTGLMNGLFSGVAHRIELIATGEHDEAELQLGDLPRIKLPVGVPCIVPVEYLGVLDDGVIDTFRHVVTTPDPTTGNPFRTVPYTKQRFPYRDLGEVSWDEWLKVWNRKR